jgi:hypothetical protein
MGPASLSKDVKWGGLQADREDVSRDRRHPQGRGQKQPRQEAIGGDRHVRGVLGVIAPPHEAVVRPAAGRGDLPHGVAAGQIRAVAEENVVGARQLGIGLRVHELQGARAAAGDHEFEPEAGQGVSGRLVAPDRHVPEAGVSLGDDLVADGDDETRAGRLTRDSGIGRNRCADLANAGRARGCVIARLLGGPEKGRSRPHRSGTSRVAFTSNDHRFGRDRHGSQGYHPWVLGVTLSLRLSQSKTRADLVAATVRLERVNPALIGRRRAGTVAAKPTIKRAGGSPPTTASRSPTAWPA